MRSASRAVGLVLAALFPSVSSADALSDIRRRGEIVWGGDQEGGGPFVFPREDEPSEVTGFEVELAAALGARLGAKPRFFQGPWDKMPDLLRTGKIDVVLNGYEWTPARAETMASTIPYYVYGLQLLVRKDDQSLRGWKDLDAERPARPRRVGVLIGTAAEAYLRERGGPYEIVTYDGNTDSMREVETGKLDATLQDTPIASFYAPRFPRLAAVDAPVGHGYYVLYAKRGEHELVRALNEALLRLIRRGELEALYRRYGIWDDAQRELAQLAAGSRFFGYAERAEPADGPALPTREEAVTISRVRGWEVVRRYGGILLQSAAVTVILSVLSFPIAVALGLLIAVLRLYGPGWVKPPLTVYVEVLRGTPVMLQLYFIFFFLPEVGINVPAFWTAILGLAVNYSAYESEIYRAGLQAIPPGQMEAALSLGMSRPLALRLVVVPQAVRIVVPPVVNDFIALFKDTSVCSVVTLVELTKRFSVLSQSTQATMELMLMTAVLYMLMSYPLSLIAGRLERRLAGEAA